MSTSQTDRQVQTGQTANATPLAILTYAHPDATGMYSKAKVVAVDGSGNTKAWEVALCTKRVSGGAVALVGALGYADSGAVVVHSAGTFTGGVGASAYTIGDIVLAMKNYGLLAS